MNAMNIKKYIAGSAILLAAGSALYSCDLKDPLDGVQIIVKADFIKTQMAVSFIDAATGDPVAGVKMSIVGQAKDNVVNIAGNTNFQVDNGIITLALKRTAAPSDGSPLTFAVLADAPGYLATSQTIKLQSSGMYMYEIRMVNTKEKYPEGVTNRVGEVLNNSITVLAKAPEAKATSDFTYKMFLFDATESALNALPLPMDAADGSIVAQTAMHVSVLKNNVEVGQLTNPIEVTLPLQQSMKAGTLLSVYAYDKSTGSWSVDAEKAVVINNGKSVMFKMTKVAYYWAIGGAYESAPVTLDITSQAVTDEVYTFNYYLAGESGEMYVGSQQANVLKGKSKVQTISVPKNTTLKVTNYANKIVYEGALPAGGTVSITLDNASFGVATFIVKAFCDNGDIGVQVLPSTLMYFREKGTTVWRTTTVQGGANQLSDIKKGATYEVKVNYDKETYAGTLEPNQHVSGEDVYEFDFELPDTYCK